jgi:WD40 repeat protein
VLTPDGRAEIATADGSSSVTIDPPVGPGPGLALPNCCVSLSADGDRVLVLSGDPQVGRAFVSDTRTGKPVWVNDAADEYTENPYVEQGDISPDGSRLFLVLDYGAELRAVDVASGDMVARVEAADLGLGDGVFWTVKVSPDGRFVDVFHGSGVARFDASTFELVKWVDVGVPPRTRSDAGNTWISDLTHVPGSNDLLAVGRLGRIYRVDMSNREVTTGQSRDASTLGRVGIGADGSVVAATHPATSTVALFDADTLEPIGDPLPAGNGGFQPWFTADGNLLGNSALGVSQWVRDPDQWQAIACRVAGRNLTQSEWAEYLGDKPYRATCPEWPPAAD